MAKYENCVALIEAAEAECGRDEKWPTLAGWLMAMLPDEDAEKLVHWSKERMAARNGEA